jgi:hypothetical protein
MRVGTPHLSFLSSFAIRGRLIGLLLLCGARLS